MKTIPRLSGLILVFSFLYTHAQISSFPYTQDFENFTNLQSTPACQTSSNPVEADNWYQDDTDGADWKADTAGTASPGTGPGATDTTSGEGLGKDVNPGTTHGIYLYIEGSFPTTGNCVGEEAGIISPAFDLSASNTYYEMSFYYHMFGLDMGSLVLDVIVDDTVYYNAIRVISGNQGPNWKKFTMSLGAYKGDNVRIRLRGIVGKQFRSDIAIDEFTITAYDPPLYDAKIAKVEHLNPDLEYPIKPYHFADSLELAVSIANEGTQDASAAYIKAAYGNYSDSVYQGTLASFEEVEHLVKKFKVPHAGPLNLQISVAIDETDSFPANDSFPYPINYSDSVLAREDGSHITGGIGSNNGTLQLGQKFYVPQYDTLTSISFYCTNPKPGDSVKIHIYYFSTSNGPGSLIASTHTVVYNANTFWYTVRFPCEQYLYEGYYFVAIEQLVFASNMALGYTDKFYTQGAGWYGNGTTWTDIATAGFEVTGLLRMNFGKTVFPKVTITVNADTVCEGTQIILYGKGARTYQWQPASAVMVPTAAETPAVINQSQTFTLTGISACGYTGVASKTITAKPGPHVSLPANQLHCKGDTLLLHVSGGSSYAWVGGPANMDYPVSPGNDTSYFVRVDSINGCFRFVSTNVKVSSIDIEAFGDTTLCEGGTVSLYATGAASYQWQNGPSNANFQFIAGQTGRYLVNGFNTDNCTDTASVLVRVNERPDLMVTDDTGACFRDSLYLMASGADTYQWLGGPATAVYPLRVIQSKWYFITGTNNNSCSVKDSVYVERHLLPLAQVSNDTSICEGETVTLHASGGDMYEWRSGQSIPDISVSPSLTTRYLVKVISTFGCFTADSVLVEVDPLPLVAFTWMVDKDSVLKLMENSQYADRWLWSFGDGDSSVLQNPEHTYRESGNYNVTLTVFNDCGEVDSSVFIPISLPTKSISGLDHNTTIILYPNPSRESVTIQLMNAQFGMVNHALLDAGGKVLLESASIKNTENWSSSLDLSSLAPGVYWLKLELNGHVMLRKVVVI